MQKVENTASFQAEDESGKATTILEYTRYKLFRPISGAEEWVAGAKSYKNSSGDPINYLGDDKYQNVMTDKVLRRLK